MTSFASSLFASRSSMPANYGLAQIKVLPSVNSPRVNIKERPLSKVEETQLDFWGKLSTYEVLDANVNGKMYFDLELYHDEKPSQAVVDNILSKALKKIQDVMEPKVDFFEPTRDVAILQSHGYVMKGGIPKYKVSFHFILIDYFLKMSHASILIKEFAHFFPKEEGWDHVVYPSNGERLLRMVGSFKNRGDEDRILTPVLIGSADLKPFHNYIITYLTGSEADLMEKLGLTDHITMSSTRSRLPRRSSIVPFNEDRDPPEWMNLSEGEMEFEARKALAEHGLLDGFEPRQIKYSHDRAEISYKTVRTRNCIGGSYTHDSNSFVVAFKPDGTISYFCFFERCRKPIIIGRWKANLAFVLSVENLSIEERTRFTPEVLHKAKKVMEEAVQFKNQKGDSKGPVDAYYEFVLEYTNMFFCCIRAEKPDIVEEIFDENGRIIKFTRRSVKDTQQLLSNAGDAWLTWWTSSRRREKAGYGYFVDRTECPFDQYNLYCSDPKFSDWSKAPLSDAEEATLEPLLDAIKTQLVSSDMESYEYLLNWLACKVQNPHKSSGVMIWFCGPQGSGKGVLLDRFIGRQVFGPAYLQVSSLDAITGKFNARLLGKVLVMVDDAEMHGSQRSQSESLKNIITEPYKVIEMKHREAIIIKAPLDFIGASNKSSPVFLDADDRRFVMFKTSSQHAQEREYWNTIVSLIADESTAVLFYRLLVNRDVSGFAPTSIPSTELKNESKILSRSSTVAFLQYVCQNFCSTSNLPDGFIFEADIASGDSFLVCTKEGLFNAYYSFMESFFKGKPMLGRLMLVRQLNSTNFVLLEKVSRRSLATTSTDIGAYKFQKTLAQMEGEMRRMNVWDDLI